MAPADRGRYLKRAAGVLVDEMEEVAGLPHGRAGQAVAESYTMEILPTIDALSGARAGPAILARRGDPYPQVPEDEEELFSYEPIGVVGVIAPWNYPWSIRSARSRSR